MDREKILNLIVNEYKFVNSNDGMDYMRKTDQLFGYIKGIGAVTNDIYFDDINKLWDRIRDNIYAEACIYREELYTPIGELLNGII